LARYPVAAVLEEAPIIVKHVDLDEVVVGDDGQPDHRAVRGQLAAVGRDLPELLTYRVGAGSGGSRHPVVKTEKLLTREQLENMPPEEINSRWERVRACLEG
jgi:hypothetical protein